MSTSQLVQQPENARRYSPGHIQRFFEDLAVVTCLPNDENLRRMMIEGYGSIENAVSELELVVESEKAVAAHLATVTPPPIQDVILGAKPKPGDRYALTQLGGNVTLRVWDTRHEPFSLFAFDFVHTDDIWQYMPTPRGLRIEAIGPGDLSQGPVWSIEKSLLTVWKGENYHIPDLPYDLNWETYLIPDGTRLRIWQDNTQYDVIIPSRTPHQDFTWNN